MLAISLELIKVSNGDLIRTLNYLLEDLGLGFSVVHKDFDGCENEGCGAVPKYVFQEVHNIE